MTMQLRSFAGAAAGLVAGVLLMSFAGVGNLLARDTAPNGLVSCGPNERMLTRQVVLDGQVHAIAECAPLMQPVAIRNAAVAPRAVSSRAATTQASEDRVSGEPKRSWQKTALVIGGAAGAGVGVGGAVKGGKGALIGAAIGGGAAAIYEAIKRKD